MTNLILLCENSFSLRNKLSNFKDKKRLQKIFSFVKLILRSKWENCKAEALKSDQSYTEGN